jgi:hypothetical protein
VVRAAPPPAPEPVVMAPPPAPVARETVPVAMPVRETEAISEEDVAEPEAAPRVFAPQTAAQGGGKGWTPPRPGSFARVPGWVLGSAIGGVVLVVCVIVFMVYRSNKSASAVPPAGPHVNRGNIPSGTMPDGGAAGRAGGAGAGGRGGASLLPPPMQQPTGSPQGAAGRNGGGEAGGHVFEPGTIVRTSDLLYIVIASTPSADVARRNAEFIAAHGVDVSIETRYSNNNLIYTLVSVQGFPTHAAAEPLRARIVEIGHLHPDYRKGKKTWDDAYVFQVIKAAAPAGR